MKLTLHPSATTIPKQPALTVDFLIIGAGKSGTTSLWHHLNQHPAVFMSPVKEPNFFALGGKKLNNQPDPDQMHHYPEAVTTEGEYRYLFANADPLSLRGEASTIYMYHPDAPKNIAQLAPHAKLIAVLRQPAERLYSRYMHLLGENRHQNLDWEQINQKNSLWWRRPDLVPEGFYYKHLLRYQKWLDAGQMLVLLTDDLKKQPQQTFEQVQAFLDIPPQPMPQTNIAMNPSGIVKNKLMDALIGKQSLLKQAANTIMPGWLNKLKNNNQLKAWLNQLRAKNLHKPKLNPALKRQITQQIYADDIKNLSLLIQRDLSGWM